MNNDAILLDLALFINFILSSLNIFAFTIVFRFFVSSVCFASAFVTIIYFEAIFFLTIF